MTEPKGKLNGRVRLVYVFLMSLIAIGSLAFTIGKSVGESDIPLSQHNLNREVEVRISSIEKMCERWDERWKNIEKWMTKIDSSLSSMK